MTIGRLSALYILTAALNQQGLKCTIMRHGAFSRTVSEVFSLIYQRLWGPAQRRSAYAFIMPYYTIMESVAVPDCQHIPSMVFRMQPDGAPQFPPPAK